MERMSCRYKQMELRLESLEKTLAEVEGAGRCVASTSTKCVVHIDTGNTGYIADIYNRWRLITPNLRP